MIYLLDSLLVKHEEYLKTLVQKLFQADQGATGGVTGGGGGVGGGTGGRVPPRDFWPKKFCWPTGKREARKIKRKMWGKKKGKLKKARWKIENVRRKSYKMRGNQEKWLCCLIKFVLLRSWVPHSVKSSADVKEDNPCFFSVVGWVGKTLRDTCQSIWCRVSSPETQLPRGN